RSCASHGSTSVSTALHPRLAASLCQWRPRIPGDRSSRAVLGRHGVAERRLGSRVCCHRDVAIPFAATMKFAVLPAIETFPAFCLALGAFLVPAGAALALSRQPTLLAIWSAMAFNFIPVLQPSNEMSYDTAQFYNAALA